MTQQHWWEFIWHNDSLCVEFQLGASWVGLTKLMSRRGCSLAGGGFLAGSRVGLSWGGSVERVFRSERDLK